MDTNRIRYFLTLAQTESVSKAAEMNHISAAAFSKAMKIFEKEVGGTLIVPHGRGILLTDYGRSIVPSLESIIQQIEAVKRMSESRPTENKVLRVATFEVFSTHFMSLALKEYFSDYDCEIFEMIPGQMEEAVAKGKVDFALTYAPVPQKNLDFLKVQNIEMGIYGKGSKFQDSEFESLPFVVPLGPLEGSPNKVKGLDGWPDNTFPRSIRHRVQLLETALCFCSDGLSVAYLPKFLVRIYNEKVIPSHRLEMIKLPKSFPKGTDSVFLIKRKTDLEGVLAKKLATAVRKFCSLKT